MPHPLLLDENLDVGRAPGLQARGFDVITARDLVLLRAPDHIVLDTATRLGRVLVTQDKDDFPLLALRRYKEHNPHTGILMTKPAQLGNLLRRLAFWLDESGEWDMTYYCTWLPSYADRL